MPIPRPSVSFLLACHLGGAALLSAARWARAEGSVLSPAIRGASILGGLLLVPPAVTAVGCLSPRSPLPGPVVYRLPEADRRAGRVALTFDDGPDPAVTPRVLDLLDRHGARASFFVVGERAAAHPELLAEIARRGHRIENHTHRHRAGFAFLGPEAAGSEIDRAQRIIEALAGRQPGYFRPVAGMRNPWLADVLAARGLTCATWTRRGFDTVDGDPRRVAGRLLGGLAAGDVLVFHDGASARDRAGRPVVWEALERVLAVLKRRGLAGVPLPEPEAKKSGQKKTHRGRRRARHAPVS